MKEPSHGAVSGCRGRRRGVVSVFSVRGVGAGLAAGMGVCSGYGWAGGGIRGHGCVAIVYSGLKRGAGTDVCGIRCRWQAYGGVLIRERANRVRVGINLRSSEW
jgi:hypothetical protein